MATIKQAVVKNTREFRDEKKASGTAIDKGEILEIESGLAIPADSDTTPDTLLGLANEDVAVSDAQTTAHVRVPSRDDTFIFPTTNASDADHNGQRMVLTNSTEVNNTGTDNSDGIVVQVEPYGDSSDKRIIGRFVTL